MHVSELWRYPVKSMAGEQLTQATVTLDGIEGDRQRMVVRGNRIITARTHPRLLALRGTDDIDPALIREIAGDDARIIQYDGPERFDVLPLLVATDGAVKALGVDGRRLRPNILIGGVDGLAERDWEGKFLRIGEVVIHMRDLRQRCVMTTWHPDTQQQDMNVLRKIVREFDGSIALNSSVIHGGVISINDDVAIFAQ